MTLETEEGRSWPGARTVRLGDREFVVPPLSLRQNVVLADVTRDIYGKSTPMPDDPTRVMVGTSELGRYVDALVIGLSRAYPKITRDDLLDLDASTVDLIHAVGVVVEQGGGKKPDPGAGEQQAASVSGK